MKGFISLKGKSNPRPLGNLVTGYECPECRKKVEGNCNYCPECGFRLHWGRRLPGAWKNPVAYHWEDKEDAFELWTLLDQEEAFCSLSHGTGTDYVLSCPDFRLVTSIAAGSDNEAKKQAVVYIQKLIAADMEHLKKAAAVFAV